MITIKLPELVFSLLMIPYSSTETCFCGNLTCRTFSFIDQHLWIYLNQEQMQTFCSPNHYEMTIFENLPLVVTGHYLKDTYFFSFFSYCYHTQSKIKQCQTESVWMVFVQEEAKIQILTRPVEGDCLVILASN